MSHFRKVSSSAASEAIEVQVSGAVENADGSYTLTVGDITSWPSEADFITYSRDENGNVEEATRVVWYGNKDDNTNITATRTGGSETYVPDPTNFATVVPTHRWANDLMEALSASLSDDGAIGLKEANGQNLTLSLGANKPSPTAGRVIVWLKPLE